MIILPPETRPKLRYDYCRLLWSPLKVCPPEIEMEIAYMDWRQRSADGPNCTLWQVENRLTVPGKRGAIDLQPGPPAQQFEHDKDPTIQFDRIDGADKIRERSAGYAHLLANFEFRFRPQAPVNIAEQHQLRHNRAWNRKGTRSAKTNDAIDPMRLCDLIPARLVRVGSEK